VMYERLDGGTIGLIVVGGLDIMVWVKVLVVTIEVVDGTVGVLDELDIVELLHSPKCCGLRFLA
jgi:hypothetical protein